jgi:UDP-N-acetylmuramate--alanine ligase
MSPQADIRAINVRPQPGGARFDVVISPRTVASKSGDAVERTLANLVLHMPGAHNVQNALAMVAIAVEMDIPEDTIRKALSEFAGVKRRFTRVGEAHGVTVIDDYGHHPVEIAAVLRAAREGLDAEAGEGRLVAVVQPHRYTRLADLFEDFCTCFNDADAVIVADVYEAGETPIEGVNRDALVDGLIARGHRAVVPLERPEHLPPLIYDMSQPGDLVVCLGAGTITQWANDLPGALLALRDAPTAAGGAQ